MVTAMRVCDGGAVVMERRVCHCSLKKNPGRGGFRIGFEVTCLDVAWFDDRYDCRNQTQLLWDVRCRWGVVRLVGVR